MDNIAKTTVNLLKDYMDFSLSDEEFSSQFEKIINTTKDSDIPDWLKGLIEDYKRVDDEKFTDETGNFISSTEFRYNISQILKHV